MCILHCTVPHFTKVVPMGVTSSGSSHHMPSTKGLSTLEVHFSPALMWSSSMLASLVSMLGYRGLAS